MEMDSEDNFSLTEADLEVRSVQLEIMKQRVADCEERVNSALKKINFVLTDNAPMVQCPFDPRHYVPLASKQKHMDTCKYSKEGIGTDEIREFEFKPACKGLVRISNELEKEILSRVRESKSSDRTAVLQAILNEREGQDQTSKDAELSESLHYSHEALQQKRTPEERSVLYEYAIMSNKRSVPEIHTVPPDPFDRLKDSDNVGEKESEVLLKLKELRDSKRRRKYYKGVHMRSLREETKSIIDLYMSNFCEEERGSSGGESKEGTKRDCGEKKKPKHRHKYKEHKYKHKRHKRKS